MSCANTIPFTAAYHPEYKWTAVDPTPTAFAGDSDILLRNSTPRNPCRRGTDIHTTWSVQSMVLHETNQSNLNFKSNQVPNQ